MNDAQTWTVIGGLLAILASQTALVLRVVRTEVNRLGDKLDHLDRDVQRLVEDRFKH